MESVELNDRDSRVLTFVDLVRPSAANHEATQFFVELAAPGLQVRQQVVVFSFDLEALVAFFEELAAAWQGFEGTRTWSSVEGHLTIRARSGHLGHVHLETIVRDGAWSAWSADMNLILGAGEDVLNAATSMRAWALGAAA